LKWTEDQRSQLIAKRRQERLNQSATGTFRRQALIHDLHEKNNLDDIIKYSVQTHESIDGEHESDGVNDHLLAFMSGCSGNSTNSGDIRRVLAAKQVKKGSQRSVNETNVNDDSIQVGDITYYLNKGETITCNGR
jgi:hypothetical protein